MPFKLLSYIIVLVFLVTFIGLNLGNTSDVNLWFSEQGQFHDVPIVVSFLVMYILGALSIVPYIIGNQWKSMRKKSRENKIRKNEKKDEKKEMKIAKPKRIGKKSSDAGMDTVEQDKPEV